MLIKSQGSLGIKSPTRETSHLRESFVQGFYNTVPGRAEGRHQ